MAFHSPVCEAFSGFCDLASLSGFTKLMGTLIGFIFVGLVSNVMGKVVGSVCTDCCGWVSGGEVCGGVWSVGDSRESSGEGPSDDCCDVRWRKRQRTPWLTGFHGMFVSRGRGATWCFRVPHFVNRSVTCQCCAGDRDNGRGRE
jgi:hypothetical protein